MRSVSFIFMFLLIQAIALSQPCLPEGIIFTSQAQIDSFQNNYPNCTEIEGDVAINGDDITNLNGLFVLTSLGGELLIGHNYQCNPNLYDLSGLDNVTSIEENLVIHHNISLTSLTGLEGLNSIGGYLIITSNNELITLSGLEGLIYIGGGYLSHKSL